MQVVIDTIVGRMMFQVDWRHIRRKPEWGSKVKESTICNITQFDEHGKPVPGMGIHQEVKCSLTDQYCREKGRMNSLTVALAYVSTSISAKAIAQLESESPTERVDEADIRKLHRSARTAFWAAYKDQIGIRALKRQAA